MHVRVLPVPGRHRDEQLVVARLERRAFDGADGAALVVAIEVRHRLDLELRVRAVDVSA